MAINFTQTDTAGDCDAVAAYCSGRPVGSVILSSNDRQCTDGGTAGTGSNIIQLGGSETDVVGALFTCGVDADVSWDAGNWTVRLNVTSANMNITWSRVAICRVNSSCVNQNSIANVGSLGISLGSTGIKSTTVSGSAQTPSVGDKVVIVFGFTNSSMSSQQFTITPDQNIDSPFTVAVDPFIDADTGSYLLTGTTSTLELDRQLVSDAGSYLLTGSTVTLQKDLPLIADAGSYLLTGTVTALEIDRILTAEVGSYLLTGTDAVLNKGLTLILDGGSYLLTGTDAGLELDRELAAAAGSYLLTGNTAALEVAKQLVADAGGYLLTGADATLTYSTSGGSPATITVVLTKNLTFGMGTMGKPRVHPHPWFSRLKH